MIRTTSCGSRTLKVEVRIDRRLRVRTWVSPKGSATWSAVVLQDRKVAWKGTVRAGEVDRTLPNLPGSEMLSVRLTSGGSVCAAELVVPA